MQIGRRVQFLREQKSIHLAKLDSEADVPFYTFRNTKVACISFFIKLIREINNCSSTKDMFVRCQLTIAYITQNRRQVARIKARHEIRQIHKLLFTRRSKRPFPQWLLTHRTVVRPS